MSEAGGQATTGALARYRRRLPWLVLGAVVGGGALGLLLHAQGISKENVEAWGLGLPGDLFLRALKMVVVPLIVAAIITGVSGAGDLRRVGKLGAWTAAFYLGTTAISVAVGLVLVNLIQPGRGIDLSIAGEVPEGLVTTTRSFGEFMLHLVSTNPVGDAAAGLGEGRLLPLLIFCVLFGGVLTTMSGPTRDTLQRFFDGLYQVMMKITDLVILLTPFGVFFLLLRTMAIHGTDPFASIGLFGLTVVSGLLIHAVVVLPLLLRFLGRTSPVALFKAVAPALLTAFSTCSSSATLPVTIDCATRRGGIPKRIVNFIVPLGATVNMDGTALYEAVAALFVAQAYGMDLSLGQQATVLVMATLAAVGTAGIPSASLVMIAVVLGALGLPLEGIGLILALDRLLDMGRTTVNVWGDVSGAAIFHGLERRGGD
ncbi:MAG: dicarboxylate/amino acid:cation symporter [Deltaproteobacteria bacterium]|jgi:Na+/H+-dicarboxylate symporter|nr:dicarboxylate/amino acid:cation symporter [Deltaproteobacteria bacterium]MBW2536079.1 dicarboxylate/amino acid:cation symporter [Deltaproteobacteria bacterium]